jgi:hypothetical protein
VINGGKAALPIEQSAPVEYMIHDVGARGLKIVPLYPFMKGFALS